MNHFTLLKSGIERWNQRRASQPTQAYSLAGQDLSDGYFYEGDFSGVDLSGADLRRACLIGANFRGADLSGADLSGAYLSDANLCGANLSAANLTGANLERADLREANLLNAQIADANIDKDQLSNLDPDSVGHEAAQHRLASQPAQSTAQSTAQSVAQSVAQSYSESATIIPMPVARFSRESGREPDRESDREFDSVDQAEEDYAIPEIATIDEADYPTFRSKRQTDKFVVGWAYLKRHPGWGAAIAIGLLATVTGLSLALTLTPKGRSPAIPAAKSSAAESPAAENQPTDFLPASMELAESLNSTSQVWAVATAQTGDAVTIFGGGNDGQITVWNESGEVLRTLTGHTDAVRAIAVSSSGGWLVSSSGDAIKVWRPKTGELAYSIPVEQSPVWSVAISPDERTLVSGDYAGKLSVRQLDSGQPLYSIDDGSTIWSLAIARDGQSFISGSRDQTVRKWDLATGKLLQTFLGHTDAVRAVAVSPNGRTLASGSWDETIKIWDMATGELQTTLDDHGGRVVSLAISPDGKTLASGSTDSTIKLWDLSTYQLIDTFDGHNDWILSMAFAPLERTLVSGSKDNTIKVWQ